jgi:zinc protease
LNIYKQNSKQNLSVNLKKSEFVANRLIDEYLFGINHSYGKYLLAKDYDAIQTEQLREFFREYYYNGKCVIFVSGKLPANLYQQLNNNFGKLPLKNHRFKIIEQPFSPATEKK